MRAIILAGGKGTRLAPYTTVFPKPLVPVGDMPILEIVIRQLCYFGIHEITLAVGHLAELIEAYFGDGSRFGVKIDYSREEKPLGTAGPLSLVKGLDSAFLVMNGDLLTTLDFRSLVEQHSRSGAVATVAAYERQIKIDLGILDIDAEGKLRKYVEKPTYIHRVSMGIYVFNPLALSYLEPNTYFDLPDLVSRLLEEELPVAAHVFKGFWLDIGRPADYTFAVENDEVIKSALLHEVGADITGLQARALVTTV